MPDRGNVVESPVYPPPSREYPLSLEERVAMTSSCRDTNAIPKVLNAGSVSVVDGKTVQTMHEGTRVLAGGYYGEWMQRLIELLRGHHEPQEELVFHHLLKHVRPGSFIVEVGSFWAYYSNWYLGAVPDSRALCVEPDENHLDCGRRNFELNGRTAHLVNASVGGRYVPSVRLARESDGNEVDIPCHDMNSLLGLIGEMPVEMLHIDAQGAELAFLRSARDAAARGLLRFVVVSTHHESISGSPATHRDCLDELRRMGAVILVEHSVEQSFSGDGLIAASLSPADRAIFLPEISVNQPESSLFGPDRLSCPFEIARTAFGPMVVSSEDRVISRMLVERGSFEEGKVAEVLEFLARNFRFVPETFVDVGANIGTHIVSVMASGRFARGIAIEMEETNFALLQANVILNRLGAKTRLFKVALSNSCARRKIEFSEENFGDHRIRMDAVSASGNFNEEERATEEISTVTLDHLLGEGGVTLGPGTLVWMDTQGHEGHVLAGGRRTFSADVPCVVMEMWPYGLERSGGRELLFEFLAGCNTIYDINAEGWVESPPLSAENVREIYGRFLASSAPHDAHTDLLCIREIR